MKPKTCLVSGQNSPWEVYELLRHLNLKWLKLVYLISFCSCCACVWRWHGAAIWTLRNTVRWRWRSKLRSRRTNCTSSGITWSTRTMRSDTPLEQLTQKELRLFPLDPIGTESDKSRSLCVHKVGETPALGEHIAIWTTRQTKMGRSIGAEFCVENKFKK